MIVAIYKPKGPTSHDIVDAVRRVTGERRVGHAGTLDPLASGVLVIAIGREDTKSLSEVVQKEKEYIATIRLGVTSTTDDEEGEKNEIAVTTPPNRAEVVGAVRSLEGFIEQVPPIYSAIKIKGRPAHRRVRSGEEVTLKPRTVEIKEVEILDYTWPHLSLRVVTGPGVYVRALARDIGDRLGTGGYLSELERIRVGEFTKENSLTIEQFSKTALK